MSGHLVGTGFTWANLFKIDYDGDGFISDEEEASSSVIPTGVFDYISVLDEPEGSLESPLYAFCLDVTGDGLTEGSSFYSSVNLQDGLQSDLLASRLQNIWTAAKDITQTTVDDFGALEAAALQVAAWEVILEGDVNGDINFDLTEGRFRIENANYPFLLPPEAQDLLALVELFYARALQGYQLFELAELKIYDPSVESENLQRLFYEVPSSGAIPLLFCVILVRHRRA